MTYFYCFNDKIDNFQVNTNPLLKHTVTLSVVGKSFLNVVKSNNLAKEAFLHSLIISASLIKAKLAGTYYFQNHMLQVIYRLIDGPMFNRIFY